jgi:hypothetical protein
VYLFLFPSLSWTQASRNPHMKNVYNSLRDRKAKLKTENVLCISVGYERSFQPHDDVIVFNVESTLALSLRTDRKSLVPNLKPLSLNQPRHLIQRCYRRYGSC